MSASFPQARAMSAKRRLERTGRRGVALSVIVWAIAAVCVSLGGGIYLAATTPPELLQAVLGP